MAKNNNNKPLEVAPWANNAYEKAQKRRAFIDMKEREKEEKRRRRSNAFWGTLAGMTMVVALFYAILELWFR